jgi:hypothetical protein
VSREKYESQTFVPSMKRRAFMGAAMAGTVAVVLGGGAYVMACLLLAGQ